MEWINSKERLPEKEGRYLVYISGIKDDDVARVYVARFAPSLTLGYKTYWIVAGFKTYFGQIEEGSEYIDVYDNDNDYHVSHWMPLPEPPKLLERAN